MPSSSARRLSLLLAAGFVIAAAVAQTPPGQGWPTYGGDPGGTRFSQSSQITRANLDQLHPVWTFHTHALDHFKLGTNGLPSFETTPVLSGDTLFLTSPLDVVFAIDARNGVERWHYDPKIAKQDRGGIITSRGVALWPSGSTIDSNSATCAQRVFIGTLDARLLALDARNGQLCAGFGEEGSVDLRKDIHFQNIGFYGMTSPPTIVGNVVVVGSTVGDNQQVDIESGAVRGYDAVTGRRLWLWEPLPWAQSQKVRTGAGNSWSVISADPALGLIYVPTGSAAPDIYGGMRPGDNRDANSVVALNAVTGKKVWAFQVVHHDVWDYDIASEPILFTWRGSTPAIAVTTKMGIIFLLDRRDGHPLVPVEERPVPQNGAPGEQLSPTQPFQNIPPLSPLDMREPTGSTYHRSPADEAMCRKEFADLRYDGLYTPPTLAGSVAFPGNLGGVNWGGAAIDPATGILYADTNRLASATRLIPRHGLEMTWIPIASVIFDREFWLSVILLAFIAGAIPRRSVLPGKVVLVAILACIGTLGSHHIYYLISRKLNPTPKIIEIDHFGTELSPQRKSPYLISRHPIVDSNGYTCTPAPWGSITAMNLNTLTKVWEKPLGSAIPGQTTGVVNFGGPIVTSSGLVFTAAAEDPWFRIFDAATGDELRKLPLPHPGQATPMTYTLDGKQYVVIAAGGHGDGYLPMGDALVAFALN
jgi:quinoprotein glucose dehydrogenase